MTTRRAMDGMTAAAHAAYVLSDAAVIFPITPASHMAETVESWSSQGKKNMFGNCVDVKEMQSEKGVAGALHGELAGGALASTFTASQGLMLMIPNMYKISGELLPGVFHVTTRSLAAHALSIFGDHQDLMAVRATGVAMLGSCNVQECMDLSLVAHLSAIEGSLPFVHFFDGFRTSDEVSTIDVIADADMAALANTDAIEQFRHACMEPQRPMVRGTAQNPDIYFQNREAPNKLYDALPDIVQANMDKVGKLTGRSYRLFDYVGAPDAEHVVVSMASSCDTLEEVVNYLNAQGQKVGLVKVRLYRPFSVKHLLAAIPQTAKVVCALDRTKEPGSLGEPLFLDVAAAVLAERPGVQVIGGRYGLSSKEFDPSMAKAVFDNIQASEPKRRFTVGITDDVTHLSLEVAGELNLSREDVTQAIFYGFGSDGTVSANKLAATIISNNSDKFVQEYSWFDSKKSGGLTISYMRVGDSPINRPYLINEADYLACHKDIYMRRGYSMLDKLKTGGIFVLNTSWAEADLEAKLPGSVRRAIADKQCRFYLIDANGIAQKLGLGARINLIMEVVYLKLANVIDLDLALDKLKEQIKVTYAEKGQEVIDADIKAIEAALSELKQVNYPASWASAPEQVDQHAPVSEYVDKIFWPIEHLQGNDLPVSVLDPAGFVPLGTSQYEKRTVANNTPHWDPAKCVQCFQCSFVCPHAAIRPYVATSDELAGAPESFVTTPAKNPQLGGLQLRIQNYAQDCVGCGSCAHNCPGKALSMEPLDTDLSEQVENLAFAQEHISLKDSLLPDTTVVGTQLRKPLLEFSGCCGGCGETPYVKLLTQLFGERLIIANATGCSSIWGAYSPAMPYTTLDNGCGPAWGNSLFEDNAEYGYGIMKAVKIRRDTLKAAVEGALKLEGADALPAEAATAMNAWLKAIDDPVESKAAGTELLVVLDKTRPSLSAAAEAFAERIVDYGEVLAKKSVWAVGGDGWAYDIDYDGLDEVVASGENINLLVLDTEGYSNTGGEMSKATQLGSVSGFSLDGKPTPRKPLGQMCMDYGYVYVAQVCLGADMNQLIKALHEADSYDGPSIVICLCPCISWGLKEGMATVVSAQKEAVRSGYWPLFRFDPRLADAGKDPLTIDYRTPDGKLEEFLDGQDRFATLGDREPARAKRLHSELSKEVMQDFEHLTREVEVYKPTDDPAAL